MSGAAGVRGPVLIGAAGKVAEAATLVLLATVVPRVLGPAGYGRFSVALTIVTLGSLVMTLGGATLLSRYVPAAPPADRAAVALVLTLRLARDRAVVFVGSVLAGAVLAVGVPAAFPPLVVGCVLLALGLSVATTLVLQADLGLGRAVGWCVRYPVQNAVLVAVVLALHDDLGLTGAAVAILSSAVAGAAVAAAASGPLRGAVGRRVAPPDGALRFGLLHAGGGALTQFVHRGGVLAVVLLTGSAVQTGFAALPIGIALAATYAVVQLFTVALPVLAARDDGADGERGLRRLAGVLLVPVAAGALASTLVVDAVVPVAFGAAYADATAAFLPAIAMVVLAPVNALAVQASALRLRPEAVLYAGLAGAAVFVAVCVAAVPAWGAAGATTAALAGTAATALVSLLLLPGAIGARLAFCSAAAVAAILVMGAFA